MSPILTVAALAAGSAELSVRGYFETRIYGIFGQSDHLDALATQPDPLSLTQTSVDPSHNWGVINRLRPTVTLSAENLAVVATALAQTGHGFFQRKINGVEDVASIERLYLSFTRGPVDVVAGKQLLNWGSGLLLNPTDPFNERPAGDMATELPGVWGARTLFAVGEATNLMVAAAVQEQGCCDPVLTTRFDTTVDLTDLAVTAIYDRRYEHALLGFDVKTELEVGAWLEGAWVQPTHDLYAPGYLLAEVGVDYSFPVLEQLYLAMEWIHQGDGVDEPWAATGREPLPDYLTARLTGRPTRTLLGANYLLTMARLSINEAWQAQVLNLLNLRDPSGTVVAQATWFSGDIFELTLVGQVSYGAGGSEFHQRVPNRPLVPASLRDQRLSPVAILWLWGRAYF